MVRILFLVDRLMVSDPQVGQMTRQTGGIANLLEARGRGRAELINYNGDIMILCNKYGIFMEYERWTLVIQLESKFFYCFDVNVYTMVAYQAHKLFGKQPFY